ncbi:U3 small nucleolar RNA-interacting protein 2 [Ischnura elegans]|uniref:U3 small nucleolar RNA-interacting protein 2 n=1 Tax=Ischnura elegans TaxID=197161 RepID=UPI001ED8BB70|nr:U3 small nucleolar RNA-interacting protein 2 [Ischnura elegans]
MPFFKYPRNNRTVSKAVSKGKKRKNVNSGKINKTVTVNGDNDEEILSDLEEETFRKVDESFSEDEDLEETAQEKRLKLAKKYLEEIEKEEQLRAETSEVSKDAIAQRLKDDNLQLAGKLRKCVADDYTGYDSEHIHIFRCKDHKLSITCIVCSHDDAYVFSGSKDGVIVKWSVEEKKRLLCSPPRSERGKKSEATVNCLALSYDDKFLASGDNEKRVQIRKPSTLEILHTFTSHRDAVTSVAFRLNTHQLFSVSNDRTVKLWSVDDMCYIETMYGHMNGVTCVDAMTQERAITSGGHDSTIRLWQVAQETQLVFKGHLGSIDSVKFINESSFFSCGDDGQLCLWSVARKKPLCCLAEAHGKQELNGEPNWISSIATFTNTDLLVSGSCDGFVRLWKCGAGFKSLTKVFDVPITGFVNALHFSRDGKFLVVGVGQEHRLGRWTRIKEAKNGVYLIPLERKSPVPNSSEPV